MSADHRYWIADDQGDIISTANNMRLARKLASDCKVISGGKEFSIFLISFKQSTHDRYIPEKIVFPKPNGVD
jgi:hypothetical protein